MSQRDILQNLRPFGGLRFAQMAAHVEGAWRSRLRRGRPSVKPASRSAMMVMAQAKRELFKSADVCELTQLQSYVLRSWEAEFPGLGKPAAAGLGRLYRRADIELVLRIKQLVFGEGLTLAGARRRLEEERQDPTASAMAVAVDDVISDMARSKLRAVRTGLEAILQMLSRDRARPPELTLVAPAARVAKAASKRKLERVGM